MQLSRGHLPLHLKHAGQIIVHIGQKDLIHHGVGDAIHLYPLRRLSSYGAHAIYDDIKHLIYRGDIARHSAKGLLKLYYIHHLLVDVDAHDGLSLCVYLIGQ